MKKLIGFILQVSYFIGNVRVATGFCQCKFVKTIDSLGNKPIQWGFFSGAVNPTQNDIILFDIGLPVTIIHAMKFAEDKCVNHDSCAWLYIIHYIRKINCNYNHISESGDFVTMRLSRKSVRKLLKVGQSSNPERCKTGNKMSPPVQCRGFLLTFRPRQHNRIKKINLITAGMQGLINRAWVHGLLVGPCLYIIII